jgi:uncharacterized repeat protein (TIGR03803 family)
MAFGAYRVKSGALAILLASICALTPWTPASAHKYTFRTLYSFCAETGCADGGGSTTGLLMDQADNLYGTTRGGGASGQGTVFELSPKGTRWKHKTLYSFCSQANCADGIVPVGNLVIDTTGNLYGTTQQGGPYGNNAGGAFELLPNATGGKWKYKQLYAFCAQQPCPDGNNPSSGLAYAGMAGGSPYDGASPLFGTTSEGGSVSYGGVAYRLDPQNRRWRQTVVYNFCSVVPDCADGNGPSGGLFIDSAGRLFGTTPNGGVSEQEVGVVYSITGTNESVTYSFCQLSRCDDGEAPYTPVLLDNFGRIVGTTGIGGTQNYGVLFEIAGANEQVLYNFCSKASCTDGANPSSGVIEDASGNMFGTTAQGDRDGVVYEFGSGMERVLYTFCNEANCTDGSTPTGGLIIDSAGNLYGTTQAGGAFGAGTVFELEY